MPGSFRFSVGDPLQTGPRGDPQGTSRSSWVRAPMTWLPLNRASDPPVSARPLFPASVALLDFAALGEGGLRRRGAYASFGSRPGGSRARRTPPTRTYP